MTSAEDEPRFVVIEKPDPTDPAGQRVLFYVLDKGYDMLAPHPKADRASAERSAAYFENHREGVRHAVEWQAAVAEDPDLAL